MATNSLTSRPARRTYSQQFKAEMVAQCLEGSIALASLAIDHGMNPNVLHRWVTEHERYGKHAIQAGNHPFFNGDGFNRSGRPARQPLAHSAADAGKHLIEKFLQIIKHRVP